MVFHQVLREETGWKANMKQLKPKRPLEVGFSLKEQSREDTKGGVRVRSYYFSFLRSLKKSRRR